MSNEFSYRLLIEGAIHGYRAQKRWTEFKMAIWIILSILSVAATIFSLYICVEYLSSIVSSIFTAILTIIGGGFLCIVNGFMAHDAYEDRFRIVVRLKELELVSAKEFLRRTE